MCICFLHITINYEFFGTHSEYNRNALKKQYATFTTLTSPTLNVTFHHPSLIFWKHELQQKYISHSRSVNSKIAFAAVTSAKLFHPNQTSTQGTQTTDGPRYKWEVWLGRSEHPYNRLTGRDSTGSQLAHSRGPNCSSLRCSLRGQRTGFRPFKDRNSRLWIFYTSTCTQQSAGVYARELGCSQHV